MVLLTFCMGEGGGIGSCKPTFAYATIATAVGAAFRIYLRTPMTVFNKLGKRSAYCTVAVPAGRGWRRLITSTSKSYRH